MARMLTLGSFSLLLALTSAALIGCDCGGGTRPSREGDAGVGGDGGGGMDATLPMGGDSGTIGRDGAPPVMIDATAFWADDPPPRACFPDGGMGDPPELPGGTPECPGDNHREGCRCEEIGATASCWPGLRVNRMRGLCRDGTTTCVPYDEFTGVWGPCTGAVLPVEGATGRAACNCFSQGRWAIDNLSPCFVDYGGTRGVWAVSTYLSGASAACPTLPAGDEPPAEPQPGTNWSTDRLTVDCAGRFELCYTLRAGNADTPMDTDCTVARVCTGEIWYPEAGATLELPPLPSWSSSDPVCSQRFRDSGGYGEMSVRGVSIECDEIDDGAGGEFVFNRVNYCPIRCNDDPSGPGCEGCMMGGSGTF